MTSNSSLFRGPLLHGYRNETGQEWSTKQRLQSAAHCAHSQRTVRVTPTGEAIASCQAQCCNRTKCIRFLYSRALKKKKRYFFFKQGIPQSQPSETLRDAAVSLLPPLRQVYRRGRKRRRADLVPSFKGDLRRAQTRVGLKT